MTEVLRRSDIVTCDTRLLPWKAGDIDPVTVNRENAAHFLIHCTRYTQIRKDTIEAALDIVNCSKNAYLTENLEVLLISPSIDGVSKADNNQSNPIQCVQTGAGSPLCPHLAYIRSHTNWYTSVPIRSALKSNKTSWLYQCLSSLFLKVLTVSASTTSFGKLFHILTTRAQNKYFALYLPRPHLNFTNIFGVRKLESLCCCLRFHDTYV